MNKEKISKLHREIIKGINYDDCDNKTLLSLGVSFLSQLKISKKVIRETQVVTELEHWVFIRDYILKELDKVLEVINQRSIIDCEEFSPAMSIKFLDLVASCRLALYTEEKLDDKASVKQDDTPEVTLIFS